jgi:hypothetical protein
MNRLQIVPFPSPSTERCSPDEGAQRRNPGTYYEIPDFAALHPGYILSVSHRGRGDNVNVIGAGA